MKQTFSLLAAFILCTTTWAQESESKKINTGRSYDQATLLRDGGRPTGGFIAPSARITQVNDQTAVMAGGQLAMVLGHQFNIGLAVYGMLSQTETYQSNLPFYQSPRYLEMGYAGLLLEPVFFDRSIVHFTVPTIIGIGAGSTNYYRIWEEGYYDYYAHRGDVFFVVEPGLNAELNIAKPLRLFAGGSYRFVMESDLLPNSDDQLSGLSFNFGIKVGWF